MKIRKMSSKILLPHSAKCRGQYACKCIAKWKSPFNLRKQVICIERLASIFKFSFHCCFENDFVPYFLKRHLLADRA